MSTSGISQAEIARRARRGRAAVGNWRTRFADFPQPNGGTRRRPTFDPDAVDRWFADHFPSEDANAVVPQRQGAGSPTPKAEPLLGLLRRALTRKPGVWLLHEQIVDSGVATAALIRRLVRSGDIERNRIVFPYGPRVLLRIPYTNDTVDIRDIERNANAVLARVGHHVTIYHGRDNADAYTPVTITHRKIAYTGYLRTCPWNVRIARNDKS